MLNLNSYLQMVFLRLPSEKIAQRPSKTYKRTENLGKMCSTREEKSNFNSCEPPRDHTTTNQEPRTNNNFPP